MTADGPRIVIVGAGGWVFPMELVRDILSFPALRSSTIVLFDIDVPSAERTAVSARELIELGELPARVEVAADAARCAARRRRRRSPSSRSVASRRTRSTSRSRASTGSIRRSATRWARAGSSAGCGPFPRSARWPRRCSEICPDALLLNYANPMAVNCWATDLLGVRIVGLCHSVQGTSELLARELGVPYDDVTFDCAGVNHTAWFTDVPPRRRGSDPEDPRGDASAARRPDDAVARRAPTIPTRASSGCAPS